MNNFCIAHVSFLQQNFERDINKNFGAFILSGWKTYQACFVFTPSVGVKLFLVDLDGRHVLHTPRVGAAGICGVYVILILRA